MPINSKYRSTVKRTAKPFNAFLLLTLAWTGDKIKAIYRGSY